MTQEEQKYYETYFDLFLTDGWKQFTKDLKEIYSSYRIEHYETIEELHQAKGERGILNRILSFEQGIEAAYASINDGDSEEL